MIRIDIPGRDILELHHLVLDYNGTIAVDGKLLPGLDSRLEKLSTHLDICVLTADTYGTVAQHCEELPVEVRTFPRPDAAGCKLEIVQSLGPGVVCLGNGYNDCQMFDAADLAIAVLEGEGMYAGLLAHADLLVCSASEGLDLLLNIDRIRADLLS